MAIPPVDRDTLLKALEEFDTNLRASEQWINWEQNKAQIWSLEEGQKRYPPKKIVSIATGKPVGDFSGGPETNNYLTERGFTVGRLRELKLDDIFRLILERYHDARTTQSFGGNHEIKELFTDARRILEESPPVKANANLKVVASYGKGNWATIPWISILDTRETETTQNGTYVVYLFREDGKGLYLKLGQGVTALEKKHGAAALEVLAVQAAAIRGHCGGLSAQGFDLSGQSDLGVDQRLARMYEASTVAAKYYPKDTIPSQSSLTADLEAILGSYASYVLSRDQNVVAPRDSRPIALLGTYRGIKDDAAEIRTAIRSAGAYATWFSFPILEEAKSRLQLPFNLYAYAGDGQIGARLRVDEYVTSNGNAGIASPWPEITRPEWVGQVRASDSGAKIFKTWFKIGDVELFDPPLPVTQFVVAVGLSTQSNLLSAVRFGYLLDEPVTTPESDLTQMGSHTSVNSPGATQSVPPPLDIEWLVEKTGLAKELLQE